MNAPLSLQEFEQKMGNPFEEGDDRTPRKEPR